MSELFFDEDAIAGPGFIRDQFGEMVQSNQEFEDILTEVQPEITALENSSSAAATAFVTSSQRIMADSELTIDKLERANSMSPMLRKLFGAFDPDYNTRILSQDLAINQQKLANQKATFEAVNQEISTKASSIDRRVRTANLKADNKRQMLQNLISGIQAMNTAEARQDLVNLQTLKSFGTNDLQKALRDGNFEIGGKVYDRRLVSQALTEKKTQDLTLAQLHTTLASSQVDLSKKELEHVDRLKDDYVKTLSSTEFSGLLSSAQFGSVEITAPSGAKFKVDADDLADRWFKHNKEASDARNFFAAKEVDVATATGEINTTIDKIRTVRNLNPNGPTNAALNSQQIFLQGKADSFLQFSEAVRNGQPIELDQLIGDFAPDAMAQVDASMERTEELLKQAEEDLNSGVSDAVKNVNNQLLTKGQVVDNKTAIDYLAEAAITGIEFDGPLGIHVSNVVRDLRASQPNLFDEEGNAVDPNKLLNAIMNDLGTKPDSKDEFFAIDNSLRQDKSKRGLAGLQVREDFEELTRQSLVQFVEMVQKEGGKTVLNELIAPDGNFTPEVNILMEKGHSALSAITQLALKREIPLMLENKMSVNDTVMAKFNRFTLQGLNDGSIQITSPRTRMDHVMNFITYNNQKAAQLTRRFSMGASQLAKQIAVAMDNAVAQNTDHEIKNDPVRNQLRGFDPANRAQLTGPQKQNLLDSSQAPGPTAVPENIRTQLQEFHLNNALTPVR